MQDCRNEVKEVLCGDEQLAAEVEFALKEAEKQNETEEWTDDGNVAGGAQATPTPVRVL